MVALNFPSSPTENQVFGSYTFKSGKWMRTLAAPAATAERFNLLINPSFQMSQQNDVVASGTSAYFIADEWRTGNNPGTAVLSQARVLARTVKGSPYRSRTIVTTIDSALAVTEYACSPIQILEGHRLAHLNWGTASAKQVVFRAWVAAPAGTYSISIRNVGGARSFIKSFVVSAGEANVLTERTFAIPGDITGTYAKDNTQYISIAFTWGTGTTYATATEGAWVAGNFLGKTGMTNGLATVNNTFDVADVGLYFDPNNTGLAPPWEAVDEHTAHNDSLRYWYKHRQGRGIGPSAFVVSRAGFGRHAVPMRINPAFSLVGTPRYYDGDSKCTFTPTTNYCTTEGPEYNGTVSGIGFNAFFAVCADSFTENWYMPMDARL
jgi:hypothetical protein